MNKIRKIYRTFIPFLVVFTGIMVIIWVFDRYAERLSREPEVIVIHGTRNAEDPDPVEWQEGGNTSRRGSDLVTKDSLFLSSKDAFRNKEYQLALEGFTVLGGGYPDSPILLNYLGMTDVKTNNYSSAIAHFKEAIMFDPSFADAVVNLASVYRKMKRLKEAETMYKRSIQLSPNDPGIYYNLGLLYMEKEEWDLAAENLSHATRLSSGKRKAYAYCHMGIAKLSNLDTIGARADLNEAILLYPAYELARINYSRTFSDIEKQLEELNKIYALNDRSFHTNFYLGILYSKLEEPGRAEYHYKKALEQDPSNPMLIEQLADLLIALGRMEEAELVIDGFVVGDTLPQAYFFQAKIASHRSDYTNAAMLYELAISKADFDYPEAFVNLAIIRKRQGIYAAAIRNYKNAIISRPNYSRAYYNLALIYVETDSTGEAIMAYKNAIRLDPLSYKSWHNLGRLYEKTGDKDEELNAYKNAIAIKPDYKRALLALGNAYLVREDYSNAAETLRDLLDRYPTYTKGWHNLGLAYFRSGQNGLAIEAFEKLIELRPGHIEGRIKLSALYSGTGRTDISIIVLEEAVNIDMANPEVRYALALQYKEMHRLNGAVYQLLKVTELDPWYKDAYNELMKIYSMQGDSLNYEITAFRKHKNLKLKYNFYKSGKRLHELGSYSLAIEAYRYAQEKGDNNVWLIYWIGKAYMDMDKFDEAVSQFEKVREINPGHKFSWYRLGQLYDMRGESQKAEIYYTELRKLDDDFKIVRKSPVKRYDE